MANLNSSTDRDLERRNDSDLVEGLNLERISLEPWYKDIEDEITQPDQVTVQSRYFWKRWARILGPVASGVFLRLRQYCYYNRDTGEKRDWCWPKQETIADELGIERKTVMEALRRLEALQLVRRERQYLLDPATKKPHRTTDKYYVKMWDPIAPEDEGQALVRAAERMLRDGQQSPVPRAAAYASEKRTYRPARVDKSAVRSEERTDTAVRKTDTKSDLEEILRTLNVSETTKEKVAHRSRLAEEILRQLGDRHSLGFYRKVVQLLPEPMIHTALSEVKDARLTGRLKGTAGAYFTYLVKLAAMGLSVEL